MTDRIEIDRIENSRVENKRIKKSLDHTSISLTELEGFKDFLLILCLTKQRLGAMVNYISNELINLIKTGFTVQTGESRKRKQSKNSRKEFYGRRRRGEGSESE